MFGRAGLLSRFTIINHAIVNLLYYTLFGAAYFQPSAPTYMAVLKTNTYELFIIGRAFAVSVCLSNCGKFVRMFSENCLIRILESRMCIFQNGYHISRFVEHRLLGFGVKRRDASSIR